MRCSVYASSSFLARNFAKNRTGYQYDRTDGLTTILAHFFDLLPVPIAEKRAERVVACAGSHLPSAKTSGIELRPDRLDPFAVHETKPLRVADGVDNLAEGLVGVHVHFG